jgi:3-isopropylmalate/(R)-2-methylmalate dehydratase small subunit
VKITGRTWKFAYDDINTDQIHLSMYSHLPIEECAKHCLETIDPSFAANVQRGDLVIAGRNFGCGSARPAHKDLMALGIVAVLAESFDRKFFRNSVSGGLLVMVCPGVLRAVNPGDLVEVDATGGQVLNLTTGALMTCQPLPPFLLQMIELGGEKAYLKARLARQEEIA